MALATTTPDSEVDDFGERRREASHAMRPEDNLLHDILEMAVSQDRICQESTHRFRRLIGTSAIDPATTPDIVLDRSAQIVIDDALNDYKCEVVSLCAIVVAATERRVSGVLRIFVSELAGGLNLDTAEREELLRPIFRESGIEHRFEPRDEYEVYGL